MDATAWIGLLVLTGTVPLLARYRPTQAEHALEHPLRRRIVEALRERPMSTKNHLRSRLRVTWSTLHHHMSVLIRNGVLAKTRIAGHDRFFLADVPRETMHQTAVLRNRRVHEVAAFIAGNPGSVQSTLTEDLSMHRKVLRSYVDRLVAAGLIEETREGRFQVYHATASLEPALDSLVEKPPSGAEGRDGDAWTRRG